MESVNISMVRPHLGGVPEPRPLQGYTLRPLGRGDEPRLAGLLSSAFEEAWSETRVAATLTRAPDVKAVYGAFRGETLVATASSQVRLEHDPTVKSTVGFVHWVATHPDHRRRGLAAAMLARLLEDFKERGYERARLVTQPERVPAIVTYLRFGFVPEYEEDGADHRAVWSGIFQVLTRAGHN